MSDTPLHPSCRRNLFPPSLDKTEIDTNESLGLDDTDLAREFKDRYVIVEELRTAIKRKQEGLQKQQLISK